MCLPAGGPVPIIGPKPIAKPLTKMQNATLQPANAVEKKIGLIRPTKELQRRNTKQSNESLDDQIFKL